MTWKIAVGATLVALSLTACGSSDEPLPVEEVSQPEATETADSGETCSLTVEQIDDDTLEILGSYLIDDDALLCDPSPEALETFAIYTDLIPADYRGGVIGFVAINQDGSGGTDGAMQDVVGPDGEPTGERYLALDVTGSSSELERTIVHEVGHTIFRLAASNDQSAYEIDFNSIFEPGISYEDAPENFVTEYAASQPDGGEDMAESWAMFVLAGTQYAGDADDDGELDVVVSDTLAADKVAFFEDYPELVELRLEILASLGL